MSTTAAAWTGSALAIVLTMVAVIGLELVADRPAPTPSPRPPGIPHPVRAVRRRWQEAARFAEISGIPVVAVGSIVILAVSGAATGLVHGLRAGDLTWVGSLAAANLAQLPAVWVLAGLALLLYGISPRLALVSWAALAGAVVVAFFAEPLQLPAWVRDDISPFTHLPQLPAADLTWGPPIAVLAVAGALAAGGFGALRRRDVETT